MKNTISLAEVERFPSYPQIIRDKGIFDSFGKMKMRNIFFVVEQGTAHAMTSEKYRMRVRAFNFLTGTW